MRTPETAVEQGMYVPGRVTTVANLAEILGRLTLEVAAPDTHNRRAQCSSDRTSNLRVPVFRDGRLSGFIERSSGTHTITCNDQGDAELQRRLTEAVGAQDWLDPEHVGIAVENGVVRLSGRGDSAHAVLALRRLAASAPCVAAVIDDLWIDCE